MLSWIHKNTLSLMSKLSDVIEHLEFCPTFIAKSERGWISYDKSLINIDSYKMY